MGLSRLPLLLGLALSGCYRYVPAASAPITTGDDVRLTLSLAGTARLAPILGERTTRLSGRILADNASEFAVAVDRTFKDDTIAVVWERDRVTIPRELIAHTERRVLDRRQTMLMTGGVIVSAVVSAVVLSRSRGSAGQSGNGGNPPPTP